MILFFFIVPMDCLLGIWTPKKAGIPDQKSAMQLHVKTKRFENYGGAYVIEKTNCNYPGYSDVNTRIKKTGSYYDVYYSCPKEISFVLLI